MGMMMTVRAAMSERPVWRDGLTSRLTYVILAVRDQQQYNCVCLANYGTLKFYPNYEFWGLTERVLHQMGLKSTYDREDYQGVHNASSDGVAKVLEFIKSHEGRNTAVVTPKMLVGVFETSQSERAQSYRLHPSTHRVPTKIAPPENEPLMLAFG